MDNNWFSTDNKLPSCSGGTSTYSIVTVAATSHRRLLLVSRTFPLQVCHIHDTKYSLVVFFKTQLKYTLAVVLFNDIIYNIKHDTKE